MVREFTYNEKDIADGKMEISKLEDDKKKQYVSADNKTYLIRNGTATHLMDAHKLSIDRCFKFLFFKIKKKKLVVRVRERTLLVVMI
jgi:hypothetical protein